MMTFSKFSISATINSNDWKTSQVIACEVFFSPCFQHKEVSDMERVPQFSVAHPEKSTDDKRAGESGKLIEMG